MPKIWIGGKDFRQKKLRAERNEDETQRHKRIGKADFKSFEQQYPRHRSQRRCGEAAQNGGVRKHRRQVSELGSRRSAAGAMRQRPCLDDELAIDGECKNGGQ